MLASLCKLEMRIQLRLLRVCDKRSTLISVAFYALLALGLGGYFGIGAVFGVLHYRLGYTLWLQIIPWFYSLAISSLLIRYLFDPATTKVGVRSWTTGRCIATTGVIITAILSLDFSPDLLRNFLGTSLGTMVIGYFILIISGAIPATALVIGRAWLNSSKKENEFPKRLINSKHHPDYRNWSRTLFPLVMKDHSGTAVSIRFHPTA